MTKLRDTQIDPDEREPENRDAEEPRGVDLWIMPYITDSSLWPILIVLIIHVAAFLTPLVLYAVRGRPGPAAATAIVVFLTLRGFHWERTARKKFGAISWLIVSCWLTSFVAAYFANKYDFL